MLPNGHVLCVAGTAPNNSGYAQDGQFFEFDGKLLDPAPAPANAGGFVYDGRMLVLPTGQVFLRDLGTQLQNFWYWLTGLF